MPCFSPLRAWRSEPVENDDGAVVAPLSFSGPPAGMESDPIFLSCGQCRSCRRIRSLSWSIRCVNEADLYDDNCFVTLTYDDDHLPKDGSLVKMHYQNFMKRLRKRVNASRRPRRIRYFVAGEYGSLSERPHYHLLLFNYRPDDLIPISMSEQNTLYTSSFLESVWRDGFVSIGDVTVASAMYAAQYCQKKVTGEAAPDHYRGRIPEFSSSSSRPGIGADWWEKFSLSVSNTGSYVFPGGSRAPIPKYYLRRFACTESELYDTLMYERERHAREYARSDESKPERLETKRLINESAAKHRRKKL